ncbi:sugar phosphate isomerase/epimerase family protein [Pontibacter brevis]
MKPISIAVLFLLILCSCGAVVREERPGNDMLYAKDNLVAWCTIPYDSRKRNSEERASMLKDLGIKSFAYDWRWEDLPNMEHELATLKKHDIELESVWFWIDGGSGKVFDEANEIILNTLEKTNTRTELWVSFPARYFEGMTDEEKLQKGVNTLQQLHARASKIGCTLALYNHEDWFGEPENQVNLIEASGLKDIGIVYNFHHAHEQLDKFEHTLKITMPYLRAVNLNGMRAGGPKIMTIGEGDRELEMLRKLKASGFKGSIGIIGHTENEDVEVVLKRNIAGLKNLLAQLGETKALRTYK